jgi:hypothetical protein
MIVCAHDMTQDTLTLTVLLGSFAFRYFQKGTSLQTSPVRFEAAKVGNEK